MRPDDRADMPKYLAVAAITLAIIAILLKVTQL